MIWAAVVVAKGPDYEITPGKVVGVFVGLLVFHGLLVTYIFVQSCFLSLNRVLELFGDTMAGAIHHRLRFRQSRHVLQ